MGMIEHERDLGAMIGAGAVARAREYVAIGADAALCDEPSESACRRAERGVALVGIAADDHGHWLYRPERERGVDRPWRDDAVRAQDIGIDTRAALEDRALKESARDRRDHECANAHPAGRLAEDRHAPRVATKARDVALDPAQGRDLVQQSIVGALKSSVSQAIVDRHDDHTFLRQPSTIVSRLAAESGLEPSAVDPEHHRSLPTCPRGPDVEEQAVLRYAGRERVDVVVDLRLYAVPTQPVRVAHAGPWDRRPGWLAPDGRGGVGNAAKDLDAGRGVDDSFHDTGVGSDARGRRQG